ncbi:hypothetical protein [Synechococcus sp. J7-Johnson]|uniref:hypothetical protein n=1 Tax=Synechococcus sp. J7-Johnson TaxID=2823737 RepID=UPI0020CE0014|nr:hypothetical protein [Synechococcus sp. J7-Johnson]
MNFILTGLYEGDFTLSDDKWVIELCSGSEAVVNKKASQGLKIPLEGSTLKISADGKSRDEHERYAMDIMLLLSLACGTGITCHRWILYWSGDQQLELWRSRSGEEIGPGPIIEQWNLKQYLEKTLPAWHEMPEEEKKILRIVIAHLNNSGTGYLDNRLFQVAQTWEYLAKKWIPDAELSDKEKDLKASLKISCRQWRKDNPTADPQGLITDRVSKAFDWPILRRQIEGLGAQVGLNLLTLGIDIDHLKDARDSVAHSITLEGVSPSSGPHHELLARAQYGLQLLLLLRLKYSGQVVNYEDGWSCRKHINSFICS